jgi:peptidyl-prolyl cis-trans isomerase D
MMRQMRENTKWIMLVTALAFVALMVFEWGMDASGQSAGGLGSIGQVNGTAVRFDDYNATYRNLYDQYQASQEQPLTSQQVKEVEDAAFDEVVNQILIQQELERRGIVVTDEELRQAARFSPPPSLRDQPGFQTDGQFDPAKYQQFLASADELLLLQLEAYYRDIIPRGKLLRQVSSGVYVTDEQLWQRWQDQNETAEIRYIPLNPRQRVADDAVTVTPNEVRSYYDANQQEFAQPARAQVRVVVIDKTPTAADSAASLEKAQELRDAIAGGEEDFAEVAALESSDPGSAAAGGDLGVIRQGATLPTVDSAVFAGAVGEVLQPVRSPAGYHIIEVQERWAQDSARVRHIVIPIARTDDSEIELFTLADALEGLVETRSLDEAAAELGLSVEEAEITDAFAFVPRAGQVSEGADWAFEEAEVGDASPVFETPQAFYALELVSSTPSGILPLEEARPTIEEILRFEKKQALVEAEAEGLLQEIRAGEPLANVAANHGLEVRSAGPFSRNDFVPGLGRYNAAIGAAFGLEPGEVSEVVSTPLNTVLIELVNRTPADREAWEAQKAQQRDQATRLLRQERLESWLAGLRETANVRDRRDEVLVDPEDQPLRQPGSPFGF